MLFGRLAQLVEHPLDVREVTGSSPVSSTRLAEDMTHRGYVLPYCFAWKEPPRWAALSTPVHARRAAMSTATSRARVIIWVKEVWRSVVERASPVSRLSETVQTARARLPASAALQ